MALRPRSSDYRSTRALSVPRFFAAGFWRLALALPFLFLIARVARQPVHWPGRGLAALIAVAAFLFAADLGLWHIGIGMTKLGNATLFGNVSSFAFAAWGLWLARRWPSFPQGIALLLAAGAALRWAASSLARAISPAISPFRGPSLHRLFDRRSAREVAQANIAPVPVERIRQPCSFPCRRAW
jgi:drug/metabolite transporter (DMT)-like permease